MDVVTLLRRLGGVGTRRELVLHASRAAFDRSVARGEIIRAGHGRYALPVADEAVRAAHALAGFVSHRSAALHWGWPVKVVPRWPEVTVRRNRTVAADRRRSVCLHWTNLAPDEVTGQVTSPRRTLFDCLRSLPFDEALAVADSALRAGSLGEDELAVLATQVRGPGAPQARRVAREASGLSANPFESVLRAIALDVPGLRLRPQLVIRDAHGSGCPDLVDPTLGLVVEADSYTWHGSRAGFRRDCRRYNRLVVLGWRVLRFTWEDVMHDPEHVRQCLTEVVTAADRRAGLTVG